MKSLFIGYFDGLHQGHLFLKQNSKFESMVLLIDNPPLKQTNWLYDLQQRVAQIKTYLKATVEVFDVAKHNMNALSFFEQQIKRLNCDEIIVGTDWHFGNDHKDGIWLKKLFKNTVIVNKTNLSSSVIRNYLTNNELEKANQLLVEPYYRVGTVVHGLKKARLLGFPTANIVMDNHLLTLNKGSYIVRVLLNNQTFYGIGFISQKDQDLVCETHIFNFNNEIYGSLVKFTLLKFIRTISKFSSQAALQKAIQSDANFALKWLENQNLDKI